MSRILCFTDSSTMLNTVQQQLPDHDLHVLSASHLTADVRSSVQSLAPDLILLELTVALDNAHLYFFLRADESTRTTPVVLVSPSEFVEQQAAILQADGFVRRTTLNEQLAATIGRLLPHARAVAA